MQGVDTTATFTPGQHIAFLIEVAWRIRVWLPEAVTEKPLARPKVAVMHGLEVAKPPCLIVGDYRRNQQAGDRQMLRRLFDLGFDSKNIDQQAAGCRVDRCIRSNNPAKIVPPPLRAKNKHVAHPGHAVRRSQLLQPRLDGCMCRHPPCPGQKPAIAARYF